MSGSRILFTTLGSLGDLYPYLALATAMQRRGHQATILTSSHHRHRVEQAGIRFRQIAPDLDFTDKTFQQNTMRETTGGQFLLRDTILPQIRTSYENLLLAARDADLLVTHMLSYAGPLVAAKTGLPWVSTVLAPLSFFSRHDSPVLASRLHGLRQFAPAINSAINTVARSTTRSWNKPVYELRRELGLSTGLEPIYEGQHSPSCVLALFSPLMAKIQPDWPAHTQVTGFPLWPPVSEAEIAETPELATLNAFLAAGPPPVVFTLGTSAVLNPGSFYHASIEATRRLGLRAVLLVGSVPPTAASHPDILCLASAPHNYLFPRASAIVHSGGIGTCAAALRAGRPMLVIPFAYDQPDNAFRLVRLGVARTFSKYSYSARRAATEIGKLLNDPGYLANAQRLATAVNAENGAQVACDALERTAARK